MASSLHASLPGVVSHLLRPGGDNRYIEIEVSVQSVAGNIFAKR